VSFTSSFRCGNIMEKQYKCSKCSKELANRHSLSRHKKKFCKERNSQSYDSVDQPSRCLTAGRDLTNDSYSSAIDVGKANNQIQPRYSQFESHSTGSRKVIANVPEKIQRKDLAEKSTGDGRQHYPDTLNMITARGNTSPDKLKNRLYHLKDTMKVFELNIPSEHGLTNFDLVLYIKQLKVPYFRGVFMRDELPKNSNPIECGIMNLNKSKQIGSHWVCFVRNKKDRIYFDSFGQITPLELQKYLKTKQEFKNNTPIIKRNTDIVQRINTHVCGHLCLVVLTSLMREQLSYQEVLDRLNYGYSQNYW
jgi:DNA-directed RNA polymerase subunit RPC12/RpoP